MSATRSIFRAKIRNKFGINSLRQMKSPRNLKSLLRDYIDKTGGSASAPTIDADPVSVLGPGNTIQI